MRLPLVDQRINELRERNTERKARDTWASDSIEKQLDSLLKNTRDLEIRNP